MNIPMWDFEKALKLIRETQETAKSYGYHIALGGGVLNKGYSNKDLDLYFLPLVGIDENFDGLMLALNIGWGYGEEFGYKESFDKPTPYRMSLRFIGTKKTDAFIGVVEAFIV